MTQEKATYYALSNPIEALAGKKREDLTREDLLKIIEEQNIERITFHYTAFDGKLKELKLPVANRRQAESILAEGERLDGSSLFKGIVDEGASDLYVVPVYRTAFFNPFETGSIDFICRFLNSEGELAPFAPDNILAKAAAKFRQKNKLDFYSLGELEFFLLRNPDETPLFRPQRQRGYHSTAPFIKSTDVLNEMLGVITMITGNVKYAHSEVGTHECIESELDEINGKEAEQVEIEFLPCPVEDMADNVVIAKWIIRNIAYQYGMSATFAPKIEEGLAGSGMHFHNALMKAGKNVMTEKTGALSKDAKKLIAGLCKFAGTLTAFGNTVAGSYLRLVPNQEAPTSVCWSDCNRSALIRVPLGWTKKRNIANIVNPQEKTELKNLDGRQTVELRSPDGSAVAHLLLAGIVTAANWGFAEKDAMEITDACYVQGNIHKNKELLARLAMLPGSCFESSKVLIANRALLEEDGIFPPQVIDFMARALEVQGDESMIKRLRGMNETDRLRESRRIMHRDLHAH